MLAERVVAFVGKRMARRAVELVLEQFTVPELAALNHDWEFWARPKQLPPATPWRSFGFLTGRGFGKTRSCTEFVTTEIQAARVGSLGLCAQNEEKSIEIYVDGPTGLIHGAPPWFKPRWEATKKVLVWPNGAVGYIRTPEVPGAVRSGEHHLSWISEIQSWPRETMDETYLNFLFATRAGYARLIWDATPKKRHPLILQLLARSKADPLRHIVVRGSMYENTANLGDGVIDDLEREFGGTQKGREELGGEMLDDAEGALVRQEWIDRERRDMPARLVRQVVAIDPAVTKNKGSDRSGIIRAGLGVDGQCLILADRSGKLAPHEWAKVVLDLYQDGCDLVVVETNKGGQLLTQTLRAAAKDRGLTVVVVDEKWQPHRTDGTVFVREIFSRGPKEDRAVPLATAYERRRISHVNGVDLKDLEEWLTTWEPGPGARSPDSIDAEVAAVGELLGFRVNKPDHSRGFVGIEQAGRELVLPGAAVNLAALLPDVGGERI